MFVIDRTVIYSNEEKNDTAEYFLYIRQGRTFARISVLRSYFRFVFGIVSFFLGGAFTLPASSSTLFSQISFLFSVALTCPLFFSSQFLSFFSLCAASLWLWWWPLLRKWSSWILSGAAIYLALHKAVHLIPSLPSVYPRKESAIFGLSNRFCDFEGRWKIYAPGSVFFAFLSFPRKCVFEIIPLRPSGPINLKKRRTSYLWGDFFSLSCARVRVTYIYILFD